MNSFKIYGSPDGLKVCEISILKYIRDKKDEYGNPILAFNQNNQPILKKTFDGKIKTNSFGAIQDTVKEEKGWRIRLEFTDDGWKTKKIIHLQDGELLETIMVLLGKKRETKIFRKNKSIIIEFQGEGSFIKFSQKDGETAKFYVTKINKFDSLKFIFFCIKVIQYEFNETDGKLILDIISKLNN